MPGFLVLALMFRDADLMSFLLETFLRGLTRKAELTFLRRRLAGWTSRRRAARPFRSSGVFRRDRKLPRKSYWVCCYRFEGIEMGLE